MDFRKDINLHTDFKKVIHIVKDKSLGIKENIFILVVDLKKGIFLGVKESILYLGIKAKKCQKNKN